MNKKMFFYEVNPLYFKDANNDGTGDFLGMLKKADYFRYLGVDAVILPNILQMFAPKTNSEVVDYTKITSRIGTFADFSRFTQAMKNMGVKVVVNLDLSSINEQHTWLHNANKNNLNVTDKVTENNDSTNTLTNTSKSETPFQTESFVNQKTSEVLLKWQKGTVRQKFLELARFWHNLGVGGFRLTNFEYFGQPKPILKLDKKVTLIELRRFYRALKEINENFLIMGLSNTITPKEANFLLAERTRVFDYFQTTQISLLGVSDTYKNDVRGNFSSKLLLRKLQEWGTNSQAILAYGSELSGRPVSRWGGDEQHNREVALSLGIIQLLLVSSPLIYYGEELGAKNMGLTYLDDFQDHNLYARKRALEAQGVPTSEFMSAQTLQNPINSHTLMAWDDSKNGGFSKVEKPLVTPSTSYRKINVRNQFNNLSSPLSVYKRLIAFCHQNEIVELFADGECRIKGQSWNRGVIEIKITYNEKSIVILSNFSNKSKKVKQPKRGRIVVSSYTNASYSNILKVLRPYETIAFADNILATFNPKHSTQKFPVSEHPSERVLPKSMVSPFEKMNYVKKGEHKTPGVHNLAAEKALSEYKNTLNTEQKTVLSSSKSDKIKESTLEQTMELITSDIEKTQEDNFDEDILLTNDNKKNHDN